MLAEESLWWEGHAPAPGRLGFQGGWGQVGWRRKNTAGGEEAWSTRAESKAESSTQSCRVRISSQGSSLWSCFLKRLIIRCWFLKQPPRKVLLCHLAGKNREQKGIVFLKSTLKWYCKAHNDLLKISDLVLSNYFHSSSFCIKSVLKSCWVTWKTSNT